nr:immunoglobulin heavy chain junction region [Macaca mulatta]
CARYGSDGGTFYFFDYW